MTEHANHPHDWNPPFNRVSVSGIARYTIYIRAPEDARLEATLDAPRGGKLSITRHESNKKLKARPVSDWWDPILTTLANHEPCTFNELTLRICGRTADVMANSNLELALWGLDWEGDVHHTNTAPILWRRTPQLPLLPPTEPTT